MAARKPKTQQNNITNNMFWDSDWRNKQDFCMYLDRLTELAISVFKWENLPKTIDWRFMELVMLYDGYCVFFKDPVMGFLSLQAMVGGSLNVYRIPINRTAYSSGAPNYQFKCTDSNSVLMYDNLLHNIKITDLARYAEDLYTLDRIIMINCKAQKTPLLIQAPDEKTKLSLKNLFQKYQGNEDAIFVDKGMSTKPIQAISTGAPFIAPQLYELRTNIWNEALTYIGIPNTQTQKKERLIADEAVRMNAGSIASRFSRLEARRQACEQINNMFDLSIDVDYRDTDEDNAFEVPDVPSSVINATEKKESDSNE